jgi:hypothetical protein
MKFHLVLLIVIGHILKLNYLINDCKSLQLSGIERLE